MMRTRQITRTFRALKKYRLPVLTAAVMLFGSQFAQAQYCASSATSTADEDIYNVTFGTLNNSSDCSSLAPGTGSIINRYSNYTDLTPPNITAGSTVPLSVQIGTCNTAGFTYSNIVGVFIDYDRDGTYSASERVYASTASTIGPHTETASITIPGNISYGLTGMRVMCIETSTISALIGCASYSWGETEDYKVNLVAAGPPACVNAPISPLNDDTRCVGSTTLRWNKANLATSYDVYLNTGSGLPVTVVSANQTDTFYTFNAAANHYVWKIVAKNGNIAATGCNTFGFNVMSSITPDVTVAKVPNRDTLCPGDTVTFTATPVNGGIAPIYQWRKNGANVGTNSPVYVDRTLTANDSVSVILTSSITGTCVTKAKDTSNYLKFRFRTAPVASLSTSGSSTFCMGSSVTITSTPGSASYQWLLNGGTVNGATSNVLVALYGGIYNVKVTGTNGCYILTDSVRVVVNSAPLPHIQRSGNTLSAEPYFSTYQWYRNTALVAGATTPTYTITQDGSYSLTVKDSNGCIGNSARIPVNELSIGNTVKPEEITIFPNPSSGMVQISAPTPVNVLIRSIEGKLVMSKNAASFVDISPLANGMYMLYITDRNNNTLRIEKLMKRSE